LNDKPANKSLWIIAQGNDMRGDDALGPMLIERLQQLPIMASIDHHWDFQFCLEHALAFTHYDCVLLVDASTEIEKPFCLSKVLPNQEDAAISHSLSPSALYKVFISHVLEKDRPPPLVLQLEIKAYQFDLGSSVSSQAQENLEKAWGHLRSILLQHRCFMAFYGFIRSH
jgi:hydrogenase maturation protease